MPAAQVEARLESQGFSCDRVQIHRLTGHEAISQLYAFDLVIVSLEPSTFDPDAALGAEADVVFERAGTELRRIHGMVASVDDMLDSEPGHRTYRLRLHPRAYRLSLVETQEIFLHQSIPDTVKQKLALVGLTAADVEMRLTGTYAPRDFVVEYKETDLAFISRLTEHLGISFFFEQHEGRDKLVFTDSPSGFQPAPGAEKAPFRARGETSSVHELERRRKVMPALWVLQDYNYRIPRVDLTSSQEVTGAFAGGVVEYGAHYKTPDEGKTLVQARAEEREAACRFYEGESDLPELSAGSTFSLEGHPRLEGDLGLLVVAVEHELVQAVGNIGGDQVARYKSRFRAVESSTHYRPARVTPKPRMNGVLTALVEPNPDGTIGSVADIDNWGRYTVRFYFDTAPLGERPKSSHRVRMIQHHSGPNYGTHLPLKAGIEVLVVFVDGDPDRPLVLGSVHNPVTPNPVTDGDPHKHRIKTAAGIIVEMRDSFVRST